MSDSIFKYRSAETEIMDDFHCQGPTVSRTLKELDIINSWLGGNAITLSAIEKFLDGFSLKNSSRPLRIADLGCGGGEMLKLVAHRARKKNIPVELIGIDANPYIVEYAKANAGEYKEISFLNSDVASKEFRKNKFDIINCTLFCHHFDDDLLARLIKQWADQTNYGIIINDIHRHWFAYYSIKWLTHLFSSSDMVKNDAKVSVLRAFRKKELESILKKAGLENYSIRWKWAFRYEVIIYLKENKKTTIREGLSYLRNKFFIL